MSIETLVDLDTLLIEVLTGRLKAAEELYDLDSADHGGGKLLLTEKEWCKRAMIMTDPAAATPTRVAAEDADVAWVVGAETTMTMATMPAMGRQHRRVPLLPQAGPLDLGTPQEGEGGGPRHPGGRPLS